MALRQLDVQRAWMLGDTPDDVRGSCRCWGGADRRRRPWDDPHLTRANLAGAAVVLDDLADLEELLV